MTPNNKPTKADRVQRAFERAQKARLDAALARARKEGNNISPIELAFAKARDNHA